METSNSILIGIITGIIATIICTILSKIYNPYGRKNIAYSLELMLFDIKQIENAIEYNHYDIVLAQSDNAIKNIIEIWKESYGFIFFPTKRKLFMTISYNMYRTLSIFKTLTIGYDNELELTERCNKIRKKYNRYLFETTSNLELSLEVLMALNCKIGMEKPLQSIVGRYIHSCKRNIKKVFIDEFIDINSFHSKSLKFDIRNSLLKVEKYKKIINNLNFSKQEEQTNDK